MAIGDLPDTLRREIEDLPRFEIQCSMVLDQAVLTAKVRGVPVAIHLDVGTYPSEPPKLELAAGWSWRRGRRIRDLECLERWNRTLGLGAPLRELERLFREEPPRAKKLSGADGRPSILKRLAAWLRGLFGGREAPAPAKLEATPQAVRARYDEVIRQHAGRVERYKGALAELMALWQGKVSQLRELGREIEGGDRRDEQRERFAEAEAEAEELLEKIRKHEAQLAALARELEEIKEDSAEMVADMALVQLEREIVDARAGISRSAAAEELAVLRRKLRRAEAAVRITKDVADLDEEDEDDVYLEAARKFDAAERFEDGAAQAEAPEAEKADRDSR